MPRFAGNTSSNFFEAFVRDNASGNGMNLGNVTASGLTALIRTYSQSTETLLTVGSGTISLFSSLSATQSTFITAGTNGWLQISVPNAYIPNATAVGEQYASVLTILNGTATGATMLPMAFRIVADPDLTLDSAGFTKVDAAGFGGNNSTWPTNLSATQISAGGVVQGSVRDINGTASAAAAASFLANDTNNLPITATKFVYQSNGNEYFLNNSTVGAATNTASASGTYNVNVVSVNGSTSAASALSFATNDTNNWLKVSAQFNNQTVGSNANVTTVNGSANAASVLSFVTNDTSNFLKVSPQLNGIVRPANMTLVNGSASAASALSFAANDTNNLLITATKYSFQSNGKEYFIDNATVGAVTNSASISGIVNANIVQVNGSTAPAIALTLLSSTGTTLQLSPSQVSIPAGLSIGSGGISVVGGISMSSILVQNGATIGAGGLFIQGAFEVGSFDIDASLIVGGVGVSFVENSTSNNMLVGTNSLYALTISAANTSSGLTMQQVAEAMNLNPTSSALTGSVQAKLNSLSAGSGTGAYTIVQPVTDGTSALQNVAVWLTLNSINYKSITGETGMAIFNLDAGTYLESATYPGFEFGGGTVTITGSATLSALVMTPVVHIDPIPGANQVIRWSYLYDTGGNVLPSTKVYYQKIAGPDGVGSSFFNEPLWATSGSNGYYSMLVEIGCKYRRAVNSASDGWDDGVWVGDADGEWSDLE